LIVHLKRFTSLGTKLKTPLNFPEVFSFDSDYLLEEVAIKERNHGYRLYAVIVHQGYSAQKGHYYCYIRPGMCKGGMPEECKGDDNKQWYKYDDESVKLIDDIESQMLST
jgi:ubiquitin C-terminal hydrolase